jgi:WXG100 family type VII secretion target
MGQSLEVVASDLHRAAGRLQEAGQRLQDGLSSVDLETRELLGSGWKGEAASAFSTAWEQWHSGAGQVVRGLQSMSDLLTVAGKEYSKIDEQAAGAVSSSFPGTGGSGGPAPGNSPGGQDARQTASSQGGSASSPSGANDVAQPVAGLAQQMMPLVAPLAQAGQVAAGLAQAVAQVAAQAPDCPRSITTWPR